MKVPVLVSSFINISSSKFVIGRLLFVLVFHVGLFVFAFLSKSRFRLEFFKVTEIRTQICLQISHIVLNLQVGSNSYVCNRRRSLKLKLANQAPGVSLEQAGLQS